MLWNFLFDYFCSCMFPNNLYLQHILSMSKSVRRCDLSGLFNFKCFFFLRKHENWRFIEHTHQSCCGSTHSNPFVTGTDLQKIIVVWQINVSYICISNTFYVTPQMTRTFIILLIFNQSPNFDIYAWLWYLCIRYLFFIFMDDFDIWYACWIDSLKLTVSKLFKLYVTTTSALILASKKMTKLCNISTLQQEN